jgi:hypothetical protein
MAKSMGWYAEGPIENPEDIAPALRRAVAKVKLARRRWSIPWCGRGKAIR